jgi:WD40 repeat protein
MSDEERAIRLRSGELLIEKMNIRAPRKPKVLASSVIRSLNRDESHGGIYICDFETGEFEEVYNWNDPDIDWNDRGGDTGVRGLTFYGDLLYAIAGDELFAFNKNWEVVEQHRNPYLCLTHESWIHGDKLYICAGGSNSILVFNLITKDWDASIQHKAPIDGNHKVNIFNPITGQGYDGPIEGGYMHTDSVCIGEMMGFTCVTYAGWNTKPLFGVSLDCLNDHNVGLSVNPMLEEPAIGGTHNLRQYQGGFIYNKSHESYSCIELPGGEKKVWCTPKQNPLEVTNYIPDGSIWRMAYVRGLVVWPNSNYFATGSSPAEVFLWDANIETGPVSSVRISNDFRNSICGMTNYEW